MYEFHGWATIQDNPAEIDAGQLDAIIQKIQLKITEFAWGSGLLSLNAANGSYYLHVGGFTNRKGVEADEVVSLYQLIGEIAPGSYGLLYTRMMRIQRALITSFGCRCWHAADYRSSMIPSSPHASLLSRMSSIKLDKKSRKPDHENIAWFGFAGFFS